jgi:LysR family transcriptional regulator, low CO2-responsive transcriptional regulator
LAENILHEVANLNHLATANEGQLYGKLKLAVVSTGKYVMPYFLTDFLKQQAGIELQMDVTNKAKVLESLEKNEVDFALVSILPLTPRVESIPLMQNRLFLVGPANEKRRKKPLPAAALAELPLIYREAGSGTRATMEQFILKQKVQVQKKMELSSNEAVKQAVIAGLGYSIVPLIGIRSALNNSELAIVPMQGLPFETTWHLIWLKDKQFSAAAQAYLSFLEAAKSQIMEKHFAWIEQYV